MKPLGERIKDLRKEKGMRQPDLCELLGISVPTLSRIESGEVHPNVDRLELIAGIFGISIKELLNDENKVVITKNPKTLVNNTITGHYGYIDGYGMFPDGSPCAFVVVPVLKKVFQLSILDLTVVPGN